MLQQIVELICLLGGERSNAVAIDGFHNFTLFAAGGCDCLRYQLAPALRDNDVFHEVPHSVRRRVAHVKVLHTIPILTAQRDASDGEISVSLCDGQLNATRFILCPIAFGIFDGRGGVDVAVVAITVSTHL